MIISFKSSSPIFPPNNAFDGSYFRFYFHAASPAGVLVLSYFTAGTAGSVNGHFTTGLNSLTLSNWFKLLVTVFLFWSCRIVLMDDAIDCLMSFSDFLYALQLQLYYQGTAAYYSCVYKWFPGQHIQFPQSGCNPDLWWGDIMISTLPTQSNYKQWYLIWNRF